MRVKVRECTGMVEASLFPDSYDKGTQESYLCLTMSLFLHKSNGKHSLDAGHSWCKQETHGPHVSLHTKVHCVSQGRYMEFCYAPTMVLSSFSLEYLNNQCTK